MPEGPSGQVIFFNILGETPLSVRIKKGREKEAVSSKYDVVEKRKNSEITCHAERSERSHLNYKRFFVVKNTPQNDMYLFFYGHQDGIEEVRHEQLSPSLRGIQGEVFLPGL